MIDELPSVMKGRHFIFVAGAEGSGTTLLLRLLSSPGHCCSLGGNFQKFPDSTEARQLVTQFVQDNAVAWDPTLSFAEHDQAVGQLGSSLARILRFAPFADQTHFFFKRSFPFATPKGRFTPDLWDLEDLVPEARYVAIYREPRAACYSALRRGFDTDLRRLAVLCSTQLTWLAAQVRELEPSRRHVVSYERLCASPERILGDVAAVCGLTPAALAGGIAAEKIDASFNERYRQALAPDAIAWLDRFFDRRRRGQWAELERLSER